MNGAVIVNGGGRTSLIIRNYAHIMREKDVLQEADANTPTRRLYFLVQAMLMRPPPPAELFDSFAAAMSQLAAAYIRPQISKCCRTWRAWSILAISTRR